MAQHTTNKVPGLLPELGEFAALLQQQGVHAALEYLNRRTPHRYTGLFRFDGDVLHNESLFDRNQPAVRQGLDAPLATTYCALVGRQQAPVHIPDATFIRQGKQNPDSSSSAVVAAAVAGRLLSRPAPPARDR